VKKGDESAGDEGIGGVESGVGGFIPKGTTIGVRG